MAAAVLVFDIRFAMSGTDLSFKVQMISLSAGSLAFVIPSLTILVSQIIRAPLSKASLTLPTKSGVN